jgi:hypothetical protein
MTRLQCRFGVAAYGCFAAALIAWFAMDAAGSARLQDRQDRSATPRIDVAHAATPVYPPALQKPAAAVDLPPPPRPSSAAAKEPAPKAEPAEREEIKQPPSPPASVRQRAPSPVEANDPLSELRRKPLVPTPQSAIEIPAERLPARAPEKIAETQISSVTDRGSPVVVPTSEPAPKPQAPSSAVVAEGRVVLRLLEHGKGPLIEIAWPKDAEGKEALFGVFSRCYGMRLAVMRGDGTLFSEESGSRQDPWAIDVDRFSGFVRQASGSLSRSEAAAVSRIRRVNRLGNDGVPVRVFPRRADAALIGGLQERSGLASIAKARSVHARYRIEGVNVFVHSIEVDGVKARGDVLLPPEARGCR